MKKLILILTLLFHGLLAMTQSWHNSYEAKLGSCTSIVQSVSQAYQRLGVTSVESGGATITALGILYSFTSSNPRFDGSYEGSTNISPNNGLSQTFYTDYTFSAGTTVYVRGFLKNIKGYAYGNVLSFTVPGTTLPTVTLITASNITTSAASSGGNVSSQGSSSVTAKGVCWSTTVPPFASGSHTTDGSGLGSFTSSITSLSPSTIYYIRAYATNSGGTSYSGMEQFTTQSSSSVPTLTTIFASSINTNSAYSGGNISSDGGSTITEKGVCYSTSQNPDYNSSKTNEGSGNSNFTSFITSLNYNTTYYAKAYAKNSTGVGYGNQISFTTTFTLPTLSTVSASPVQATIAFSGGYIISAGSSSITDRGVCYNTSPTPTISDNFESSGVGQSGGYTTTLSNLTPSTYYYARAYATTNEGTAYGNQIEFTTTSSGTLATVSTSAISAITQTTASGGGNVTADGGLTVTSRGLCWSTSHNPTTSNSWIASGSGTGVFTANIVGLSQNTTYYVRAFAVNLSGTAYGNEVGFTTLSPILYTPTVSTTTISNITQYAATTGGNISSDGGATVTNRGIEYSLYSNFSTIIGNISNGTGVGSFAITIETLYPNTTYYVRAYATNSVGTGYGNVLSFTTLPFASCPSVGDSYEGGVVVYVYQSGDAGYVSGECHGIIKTSELPYPTNGYLNMIWGDAIYTCTQSTYGGKSDWSAPSGDAVLKIIALRNLNQSLFNYPNATYWTGTDLGTDVAGAYNLSTGTTFELDDDTEVMVIAIRYF